LTRTLTVTYGRTLCSQKSEVQLTSSITWLQTTFLKKKKKGYLSVGREALLVDQNEKVIKKTAMEL